MITRASLKVYDKAVVFAASAEYLSARWSKRYSVSDHFLRAAESVALNLAEAARLEAGSLKATMLDYAIGSSLECAACLDIALILELIEPADAFTKKQSLREVTCMLVGLRKSWLDGPLREDIAPYSCNDPPNQHEHQFHHEGLDAYKVGLDFWKWLCNFLIAGNQSSRLTRQLDKASTSLLLNIAEGNGRFSALDQERFLDIAAASAVKVVAYLDLCQERALPAQLDISSGREFLTRITAMLSQF
jgi:four helix bundle protein